MTSREAMERLRAGNPVPVLPEPGSPEQVRRLIEAEEIPLAMPAATRRPATAPGPADGSAGLRRGSRLSAVAVLLVLLLLAAAATAAVLLIAQGAPLPPPHAQDLRSSGIPLPGSARLAGLDAPDPDGNEPPWDLRLSRTASGETCTAVGQVVGGQFGIVGLDHKFREAPLGSVDSCGIDSPYDPAIVGARTFIGTSAARARTVVSGVAGAGTRSVTVYAAGSSRRLALGPDGSFITVYSGEAETVQPLVMIVDAAGRNRSIALFRGVEGEVPDPAGGSGWAASAEPDLEPRAGIAEDCVQATRQPSQSEPSHVTLSLTPEICGYLKSSPLFVQIRRFVPGEDAAPYPWGDNPSRTIVYGIATPRVERLSLSGAGATRGVPIDRRGGSFLAVLDGHVDPRSLALTAMLSNGTSIRVSHPSVLYASQGNRRLAPASVPAYRQPEPVQATLPPPFQLPISSTVTETLRARDPAGEPEWVLRSWQGRPNPHVRGVGSGRFYCEALGVVWHGRLVEPSATPSANSPALSGERCNSAAELERERYALSLEAFLDDPYAYAPAPARAVLSGMLPPGARDPVLLGIGAPQPLTLDANHAFLLVLPGSDWNATPRITYLLDGRRIGRWDTRRGHVYQPGTRPQTPQVRAPDPGGAAPWGFYATRGCSTAIGRVVDGKLASIDPVNGVLKPGAEATGDSSSCITRQAEPDGFRPPGWWRTHPVELDTVQLGEGRGVLQPEPALPAEPEVERRTLPGRTAITGIAEPDVVSVTLTTPSGVQTLRPEGPLHAILAVYAGYFVRGSLTAAVRLSSGRVLTETLPSLTASAAPQMSLASQLSAMIRQLHRLSERASRRPAPTALGFFRSRIAQIERRLSYERAHPGALPAT